MLRSGAYLALPSAAPRSGQSVTAVGTSVDNAALRVDHQRRVDNTLGRRFRPCLVVSRSLCGSIHHRLNVATAVCSRAGRGFRTSLHRDCHHRQRRRGRHCHGRVVNCRNSRRKLRALLNCRLFDVKGQTSDTTLTCRISCMLSKCMGGTNAGFILSMNQLVKSRPRLGNRRHLHGRSVC